MYNNYDKNVFKNIFPRVSFLSLFMYLKIYFSSLYRESYYKRNKRTPKLSKEKWLENMGSCQIYMFINEPKNENIMGFPVLCT